MNPTSPSTSPHRRTAWSHDRTGPANEYASIRICGSGIAQCNCVDMTLQLQSHNQEVTTQGATAGSMPAWAPPRAMGAGRLREDRQEVDHPMMHRCGSSRTAPATPTLCFLLGGHGGLDARPGRPGVTGATALPNVGPRGLGGNVEGNTELLGGTSEKPSDVPLRAEPQGAPVVESGGERLVDEPPPAKPGPNPSCLIEKGAGVEDLQNLRMWEPERVTISWRQRSQSPGELPTTWSVDALQEPPVPARGRTGSSVSGRSAGHPSLAKHHADGQVLVDHDHRDRWMIDSVGVCLATEKGIRSQIGVKCSLELLGQIARGDLGDDLATFLGDAGVSGPPAQALLLGQVCNGHGPIMPVGPSLRHGFRGGSTPQCASSKDFGRAGSVH